MSLFKGYHSLFRYLGMIGALFAVVQVFICIPLAILGFLFACIKPEISSTNPIEHAFCHLYFTKKDSVYDNYINPSLFLIIMLFAIVIYTGWLVYSVILLEVYLKWHNENDINQITVRWLVSTVTVCVFDFVIFLLFLMEYYMIVMDTDLQGELIKSGNLTKEDLKNEFLSNIQLLNILKQEEERLEQDLMKYHPNYTLAPDVDTELNPFVENQMNTLNKQEAEDDLSFYSLNNNSTFDINKNYGVWSWYAAPPAIVMTVIMKTYIGYVANIVILCVMYNFYIHKDSNITTLASPLS